MTCLHISIVNKNGSEYQFQIDNLRMEDATDNEIAMANTLENFIADVVLHAIGVEGTTEYRFQSGPGATHPAPTPKEAT